MSQSAEKAILKALKKGPMHPIELMEAFAYRPLINEIDRALRINSRDDWDGSSEQKALGELVESGEVRYQRDRQQTVWYLLPGQELPDVEGPSVPSFRSICQKIYDLLSDTEVDQSHLADIGSDDCWHEFMESGGEGSLTLELEGDGFSLADGDPICNWCGNTFTEHYPEDVDPATIVKRIVHELREQERLYREEVEGQPAEPKEREK